MRGQSNVLSCPLSKVCTQIHSRHHHTPHLPCLQSTTHKSAHIVILKSQTLPWPYTPSDALCRLFRSALLARACNDFHKWDWLECAFFCSCRPLKFDKTIYIFIVELIKGTANDMSVWMASLAVHCYWSTLWLSWWFNPSFNLFIRHWCYLTMQ